MINKIKNIIPDSVYLKMKFKKSMGYSLNLKNPQTFNEKLQWLKLYNRNPEYTMMVDKYAVKKYISKEIGDKYIIPTLGVWNSFDEIDFDSLPDKFVLKCTHDSGGLIVCRDKSKLDMNKIRKIIETSLLNNFFYMGREWPYKNVPHRIIAEQYMADDLRDNKLLCFEELPRLRLVCSERFIKDGLKEDFYDEAWDHLNVQKSIHGNALLQNYRPKQYELIKLLAKQHQNICVVGDDDRQNVAVIRHDVRHIVQGQRRRQTGHAGIHAVENARNIHDVRADFAGGKAGGHNRRVVRVGVNFPFNVNVGVLFQPLPEAQIVADRLKRLRNAVVGADGQRRSLVAQVIRAGRRDSDRVFFRKRHRAHREHNAQRKNQSQDLLHVSFLLILSSSGLSTA